MLPPSHTWRIMLAASLEQDCHAKCDNGSEANPPGEFHYREPARLRISSRSEKPRDIVRQSAQNCDHDEADDHGEDVAKIIAASPGEYSAKKDAEERAISVSEDAEDDRDNTHIRMHDDQVRRCRCYDDHENGEPTRGPPDGAQALLIRGVAINISFVPIASKAGGQRVQSGAERAHRRGENSCNQEAAQADWHFVKDEMAERFVRRFGQSRIGMRLVIGPE